MFVLLFDNDGQTRPIVNPHGGLKIYNTFNDAQKGRTIHETKGQGCSIVQLIVGTGKKCEMTGCGEEHYPGSAWCFYHGKKLANQS